MGKENINYEKITYDEYIRNRDDFDLDEFKNGYYAFTSEKRRQAIFKLNLALSLALLVLSVVSVFLLVDALRYKNNIKANLAIQETALDILRESGRTEIPEALAAYEALEVVQAVELEAPSPTLSVYPEIVLLREQFQNPEIIGYLSLKNTNIQYPVVQSGDNSYYLERDLYGNLNVAGSIFADYDNAPDFTGKNAVIYGHNMKDGSMFHNIRFYGDERFYLENPYIDLITVNGPTRWEIFSFFETTVDFYYIQTRFPDDDAALNLFTEMQALSLYDTGVRIHREDTVLTLSTCTNRVDNQRYVLCAKKIEP